MCVCVCARARARACVRVERERERGREQVKDRDRKTAFASADRIPRFFFSSPMTWIIPLSGSGGTDVGEKRDED